MLDKLQNPLLKNSFNVGLLAVVLVPLLALSFYNHPSIVDDFCYIDTVFKYGYFEAMHYYYSGWTGRYFGILLNHSNPLIWHWYAGFKVLSAVLILGFCGSIYWLIKTLLPQLSKWAAWGMVGVVFFMFVLKMPSITEAFYWMAAFVTYTIPNVLTLCLVVVMIKYYEQTAGKLKTATAVFAAFLVFATIGCSETNLIITVLLVAGWFGYQLVIGRKFDWFALFLVAVAGFCLYLTFASEGNANRIAGNPVSGEIWLSAGQSLRQLAKYVVDWLVHSPLPAFTLFWILLLFKKPDLLQNRCFSVPVWVGFVAVLGILWGQVFTSYYGIGIEPPPRVVNSVYLYFLLGWFYNVALVVRYFSAKRSVGQFSGAAQLVLSLFLTLIVGQHILRSNSLRTIYGDWLRGRAAAYDQELNARYEFMKNTPGDTLYVAPLKARPASLFMDDLNQNQTHLWNRCVGGYFGKKVVYLKTSSEK